MQIQAERTTLKVLLGVPERQLRIPPYQRPYAWEEEQVDELWSDMLQAIGSSHFMGSLVLTGEDPNLLDVIDGQQRLTTLFIVLGLIRDRWTSLNPANIGRVQRFLTESYVEGDARYRLRSGDANWVVFRSYVLAETTSAERREWANFGQREDAHVRARNAVLASNADRLARKLDGWLEKFAEADRVIQLERLERTILDGLEFVKIHVTKVADAFVIFETLNDRGLALSAGDLLKNHLLQNGARDGVDLDDMAESWEDVIANLQSADVTRFLRHYLLIEQASVRKDDVFGLFKTRVERKGSRALLEELLQTSRWYGQFVNPDKAETPASREVLHDLNTLRAVMCYTALLAARRFALPDKDFVALARLAETLTFRYSTICGRDAKDLERTYHLAAKTLWDSQGRDVIGARQALIAVMPDRDAFIASFRTQVMGQKYVVDYTLRKIEAFLDTEEKATRGTTQVHVEHIMPQSLSDDWRVALGERAVDHASYVNRWGNLTLLGGRRNSKASNASFATKSKIYQDSAIQLTKRLLKETKWDYAAIERRQLELAELADQVWPVPAA
jgi:Protein of unknown function DUF262/Protein of unknown function (DUF1524)